MLNKIDFGDYQKITAKSFPREKGVSSGHRACQGCVEVLALNMVMKAAGPNVVVASATGCMEIISSSYPQTAWLRPWIHVAFENAAAVASGVESALRILHHKGKRSGEIPKVIAVAGDGGTADIGLQALSGALERGHNFVYVCLDNEAYMNTGIQRSSSTPYGATTTTSPMGKINPTGQLTWKKNLPAIAAAHEIPYVATASPAYHVDLVNKVRKALSVNGPAYLHIFSCCPTGWGNKSEKGIELSRMVVQNGIFPLYEVIGGQYVVNLKPKELAPVNDYLKAQKRFKHLKDDDIAKIQDRVKFEWERLLNLEAATAPKTESSPTA